MKVTLRKAHRLVNELNRKLAVRAQNKIVHQSASDEEVQNVIAVVEGIHKAAVEQALLVVEAISEIRLAVQAANGRKVDGDTVDSLLNKKVQIEAKMRILSQFSSVHTETQDERVKGFINKVQDTRNSTYEYRDTNVIISGSNVDAHNAFNAQYVELKKEQESVSDKLAYINNKLEIEVDDKFAELFKVLQVL